MTLLGAGRAILYPFIRHPTAVQYSTAERFRVKRLIKATQRGQCHLKEDMSEELLDRVRDGLLRSPFTVNRIRRLCEGLFAK